jgi:hypothetical protein
VILGRRRMPRSLCWRSCWCVWGVCHLLRNPSSVCRRRIHLLAPAILGEADLWPVHAIREHEVLALNLAAFLEVVAGVHHMVDTLVDGNHVHRYTIVRFGRTIMNDPEAEVWLGAVYVVRLRGHQAESASSMERFRLTGLEAGFM